MGSADGETAIKRGWVAGGNYGTGRARYANARKERARVNFGKNAETGSEGAQSQAVVLLSAHSGLAQQVLIVIAEQVQHAVNHHPV